jgi:hypothetical protein
MRLNGTNQSGQDEIDMGWLERSEWRVEAHCRSSWTDIVLEVWRKSSEGGGEHELAQYSGDRYTDPL